MKIASGEANDEVLREIVRWATAHSPLIDTIKNQVPLSVDLVPTAS